MTMKKVMLTAALAALMSIPVVARAGWYVGHDGTHICVPLEDIGPHGQRPYHGGGMHTPADFQRAAGRDGFYLHRHQGSTDHVVLLIGRAPGGSEDIGVSFFDDRWTCQSIMSQIER